mgnify:CR=1 FL=1
MIDWINTLCASCVHSIRVGKNTKTCSVLVKYYNKKIPFRRRIIVTECAKYKLKPPQQG